MLAGGGRRARHAQSLRQDANEGAALAGGGFEQQVAAQKPRRLARDRQPQPGAGVPAIGLPLHLFERGEHPLARRLRDTDAGVADRERHGIAGDRPCARPARPADPKRDLTTLGELERIAEQVDQNPLDALAIGHEQRGRFGVNVGDQREPFMRGSSVEQSPTKSDEMAKLDRLERDVLLARFNLRKVEHFVDQAEQVLAGTVNRAQVLDLLGRDVSGVVLRQQMRQEQHAVERRPQLVRHVGQKLRLVGTDAVQLVGLFGQHAARALELGVAAGQLDALLLQLVVGSAQLFLLSQQLLVVEP